MNEQKKYLDKEGLSTLVDEVKNYVTTAISEQHTDDATIEDINNLIIPTTPLISSINGHDFIEIGGLKWATMNIGAQSLIDTGEYFQWADTLGYTPSQVSNGEKVFDWANYKYSNSKYAGASNMTKYNATDEKIILDPEDDAATANWGSSWRMPTTEEFQSLIEAVNTEFVTNYQNTGSGLLCTDKTDSSKQLFFPAGGYIYNDSLSSISNVYAYYWSSTVLSPGEYSASILYFQKQDNTIRPNYPYARYNGMLIRPISD